MADFTTTHIRASKEVIDSILVEWEGQKCVDLNLMVQTPDDIYQGNLGTEEEEKYGDKVWRVWNKANWGTNRNAFAAERKSDTSIYFETCWSSPQKALVALSLKFPDEVIQVRSAGELSEYFAEGYSLKNGVKTLDPKAPRSRSVHIDVTDQEHLSWKRWNRKVKNRKFT